MLCSDALTACVRNNDIKPILKQGGSDQQIVDRLIKAALEGGGNDNVTVVIVSAPEAVKYADSDTHVTESLGRDDSAYVPDSVETEDTERNRTSRNQSMKVAQS